MLCPLSATNLLTLPEVQARGRRFERRGLVEGVPLRTRGPPNVRSGAEDRGGALRQRPAGGYAVQAAHDRGTVSDAELERLAAAGVRGARFNFLATLRFDWDRAKFERTVARIAELGWVTLVHGTADELVERMPMLRKVRTPVVIDHMAHWNLERGDASCKPFELFRELLGQGNFWIKLSNGDRISLQGYPYDDTVALAQAFIDAAQERAIWATDWPHIRYRGRVPNDAELVELLFRYVPDAHVRQRVLVENPARLFGFEA